MASLNSPSWRVKNLALFILALVWGVSGQDGVVPVIFSPRGQDGVVPVIFSPGYGGSDLFLLFKDAEAVPPDCAGLDLPVGRSFLAMPSGKGIVMNNACLSALFSLPTPSGIEINVEHFGTFKGISSPYWSLIKSFEDMGYSMGKTFFGAPYDYRLMTRASIAAGYTSSLKALVERVRLETNRKVVLMAHSNGPPTQYSFLSSMTAEWRRENIAALISLSGNFLGQMNGFSGFLQPNGKGIEVQEMEATWDASYLSCTWGGYDGVKDAVLATTNYGTASETNYSSSLQSVSALFDSAGKHAWSQRLAQYYGDMDRSVHPDVATYCLYGEGLPTSYSFAFAGNILEAPAVVVRDMDGDDNQDIFDNAFCTVWRDGLKAAGHAFEAEAFKGVGHMQMISDDKVLTKVNDILKSL